MSTFMDALHASAVPEWICVGRRVGPVAGATIQLTEAALARWFTPGRLVRAGVDPLASARDGWQMRTGEATVVEADEEHGTVTFENAHCIVSFADGDYLFVETR